jgi:NAD-dependent dihydropyrimidine dehydrogenase PreA subunit
MFERYHIETKEAPPRIKLPSEFLIERYNNCTNVEECIEACIYDAHAKNEDGDMADPISDSCRGCHLCSLKCPKSALSIEINPEFKKLGNSYFTPERIKTIYFEAETGRVPVSGTGYKGLFSGKGFDSIWFDFSEIVRPTRDGIHGREYISTSVDLGRKLPYLMFDDKKKLLSKVSKTIEIPIPLIFDVPLEFSERKNLQLALAKAAFKLNTFAIVDIKEYSNALVPFRSNIIPRLKSDSIDNFNHLIKNSRIVEVDYNYKGEGEIRKDTQRIKAQNPSTLISFRSPYNENSPKKAEFLTRVGADIIHFYVDDKSVEKNPEIIKNFIRNVHSYLVEKNLRDEITFISSGGIAEAAHVPKSIILGADLVSLNLAYQIALGCKVCYGAVHEKDCPIKVEKEDIELTTQRIINLIASWRDQLLEVLGGMGLREVRRQRGEVGRAMFFEELEEKIFGDGE